MRSKFPRAAAAALLLCVPLLTSEAQAHGGAYRGPAGEVPPETRDPADPPPPPESGGPTTPGGQTDGPTTPDGGIDGGPKTGDGSGSPPSGSDGGTGPTTPDGGAGGVRTGGPVRRGAAKGPGYDDWTYWWTYNKDEILRLKARLDVSRTDTGATAHAFGRRKSSGTTRSATATAIEGDIVPALRRMLESEDTHYDMRSAAAIGLAKIGDVTIVETLERMARNDDGAYHRIVEESAALAFGLLQQDTPQVRETLIELLGDADRNASFVRPFAAISLGLLRDDSDAAEQKIEALVSVVAGKERKPDVKPSALLALGLLGDERAVPDLLHMLANGRAVDAKDDLNDVERSFVVQALGKIGYPHAEDGDHAVARAVADLLSPRRGKRVSVHERRSAAIALGQLAPACDETERARIIKLLKSAAKGADDTSEQAFAMIALGRLAGSGVDAETRLDVARALRHHMDRARPANLVQPFAGLALALAGGRDAGDEDFRKPLREKLEETARGDPRVRGAFAIALGLVGDSLATEPLAEILRDRGNDDRLRAYSAVALGMIGDAPAIPVVRRVLTDDDDRTLRTQAAVAAGLLGDGDAVDDLVAILEKGRDGQYVLGSVALALGQIGDERAIAPLLKIAADPDNRHADITRALATVALGQIGDRREVPVLARVAVDINFRTLGAVPALNELLTIL